MSTTTRTGRSAADESLVDRVEAALAELRAGRPVLVADGHDREDEVDVVLPAATADAAWVAWTVRHSSGYLCAPLPAHRADELDLPLMVARSQDPRGTAYTVSVDAADGVGTGISATDRARTLRVLADPATGPGDLVRPGHVLPLRAVSGGVLERAGHTEAAVDLCRLTGVGEVAAIAELVEDDGAMTRRPQAAALARRHGLALLTVADLVAYRTTHDRPVAVPPASPVRRRGSARLPTAHGEFVVHAYADLRTGDEHLVLTAAAPPGAPAADPLVRLHSECRTGDALDSARCDCGAQLRTALARVAREGGAVVHLGGHEGRGIGLLAKIEAYALQDLGADTVEANLRLGHPAEAREYGAAAAVLADLGMVRVRLLTNNPAKVAGLVGAGLEVSAVLGLEVGRTKDNHHYLLTKRTAMGHHLPGLDTAGTHPGESGTTEEEHA
ncbi:3,4-dihydroxy-2-butanone-4-phosphate synthase [Georgenia satyanarayanai]|uniref:3,4-dihydroxy-2-butanone-4-phosphate synthase n=1 Tax=Georgenia satyanarayanai TaxID=860221 RepID=UPI001264068C|nr:3,4-dihydroxy-2-butanone-4-phosphate synthase [Georgenia satyanarayanai]